MQIHNFIVKFIKNERLNMKKIFLVSTIILISVLMLSCSKNDNSTNDKVVGLSNKDYITKMESTVDEISSKYDNDYAYELEGNSRNDDYDQSSIQKDPNSDAYKSLLKNYEDNQIKYKQISKALSKFESKEEKVNEMHKQLIKSYSELSEAYKEKLEIEAIYYKGLKEENLTEREEVASRNLENINNTIENTWTNLGSLLKVEF
jgi:ABC-type Fe3+-citrate transport system substrate-binding protein